MNNFLDSQQSSANSQQYAMNSFKRKLKTAGRGRKTLKLISIIFLTALSVQGLAQTSPSSGAQQTQPLSLSQAIKTGLENSKNLKLSKAKVDIANAKYNEAIDATIPSLKFLAGYTRFSDVPAFVAQFPGSPEPTTFYPNIPNQYNIKASLSEVVFSGFRLKYAEESQKLLQKSVSLDTQNDSDQVVFNIVSAYYNIYKINKSQEIIAENLEDVKKHLKEATDWENQGIVIHNEVLRWELQQANIELTQLDLDNNLNVAVYNMNIMLGMKEDTKLQVDSSSVFPSKDVKSLPDYMQQATLKRGDLLALDARRKSSENNLRITQNSYYPIISVGANYYDQRPNQRYFPLVDEFKTGWDAGITLTWDLTNLYSNKHNIDEYKASLDQAEVQQSILSDNIKMEVNQNYLSYIEAKKKLDVMEKAIVTADENYRIMNDRYQNQLALQTDVLDANNDLVQAKINLVLARADAEVAYYKLLKSTGEIN